MRVPGFTKEYGDELLLPVRPIYVGATLLVAFMLNLIPLTGWALAVRPDFVALTLLFWGIEHPRRVGFLPAWLIGLLMDVADGSLLGQHALAYSVLMFGAIALHRRVPMFGTREQVLHILGLLLVAQLIVLGVRTGAGGQFPGWWYFVPAVTGALAWPAARILLTVPLRPKSGSDAL